MPYVQEDFDKTYFLMSYRHDAGSSYSTRYMLAATSDLTTWYGPETASDTGAYQPSNWFAHVAVQRRPDGQDYPCLCWSDLRDASFPISATSQTHIAYSTYGARWDVDTDPTGLFYVVDSDFYNVPTLFNWPAGYEHLFEVVTPQSGGGGETYYFDYWSDGGAESHTVWSDLVDQTMIAYFIEVLSYGIPLHVGWNLVSLPYLQQDEAIGQVLLDIRFDYDFVRAYNETHPDKWLAYYEFRPAVLNTLHTLDHKMGFWIYMNTASTLIVEGFDPGITNIQLYAGWNLVGYPTMTPRTVSMALAGTGYDAVEGYDGADPYHISPMSGSDFMLPGNGYWIHVPVDTVWTVNW
jgi:hypothetical protein